MATPDVIQLFYVITNERHSRSLYKGRTSAAHNPTCAGATSVMFNTTWKIEIDDERLHRRTIYSIPSIIIRTNKIFRGFNNNLIDIDVIKPTPPYITDIYGNKEPKLS